MEMWVSLLFYKASVGLKSCLDSFNYALPLAFLIVHSFIYLSSIFVSPPCSGFLLCRLAMAFVGTQKKCKSCQKTVYPVDELTADGVVFHRSCFRCSHCKGTLKLSNYSSFEGTLYCKPHFDQLFKMTGSLERSFETGVNRATPKAISGEKTPTRFSSIFSGTQDKCISCGKTVYPIEKVSIDGVTYHKYCFKCSHGGCSLTTSNHIAHEGRLYCRHHHAQLFKEKGDYSQLEKMPPPVKLESEE